MGFISPTGVEVTNIGKSTYCAVSTAFTPGATPQDIFTIIGSATKQVRVVRMGISTTQGTEGVNAFFIAKRSTANTTGTFANPAIVPLDSSNIAATAVVSQYTATPGADGTLVGYIAGGWVNSPKVTTAGIGAFQGLVIDFADMYGQPIVLRGVAQTLGWNFKAAALPAGLSVIAFCQWTEE